MSRVDADYTMFFRREFPDVVRVIHLMLRDAGRAEEISQDAFLQLLLNWPKVSAYERPDAWVRRVAIRLAMRVIRRERLWAVIRPELRTSTPPHQRDLDIPNAIRRLPGAQRAAIVLFYLEDRPVAEVAEMLGCGQATVRVHLHRGRRRLAKILGEDHPDAA